MRKAMTFVGLLALAAPLGGCFEDAAPRAQATSGGATADRVMEQARHAAEEKVRLAARDGSQMRFRAVETYRQAMADTYAVCGQATVTNPGLYLPFVSIVSAKPGGMEVEQHIGRSNTEATRVYVELVGRCFEGGGPMARPNGMIVTQQTPPLPNGLPLLEAAAPEPERTGREMLAGGTVTPAASSSAAPAASGTLVMKTNGNLRTSPGGGGQVIRVARAGSSLNVFGTAPGGWYQVGDGEAEGWVHSSVGAPASGAMASAQ